MYKIIKGASVETMPLVLEIKHKAIHSKEQHLKSVESLLDEANRQAEKVIMAAEQQANDILERARARSEKIKNSAEEQGYRQGIKKAEAEAGEIRRQAQEVLRQTEADRRKTMENMEREITSLAVEIAEKMLAIQLELDQDIIIKAALEAIKLVKDRERVTFYVNPGDMGIYIAHKQQLERTLPDRAVLSFIADPEVNPGGCLVDTDQGLVDATIDERWKQVLKVVRNEDKG